MLAEGIDVGRINRLLMEIHEALGVIKKAIALGKKHFLNNIELVYAVRYAIITIVEAISVITIHVLEKKYGVVPETYSEAVEMLGRYGVIQRDLASRLKRLVALRDILVHKYWSVDDSRIYDEATGNGVGTIEEFIREIKDYISREKEKP